MKINWDRATLVPIYDEARFPSHVVCDVCNGAGGFDSRPRHGGDRMEPDDYYWNGCDACDEQGEHFCATAKAVTRRRIKIGNHREI